MAWTIGFFSDDYNLLHEAASNTFSHGLHYSPLSNLLWRLTAAGYLQAQSWHFLALGFHFLNSFLVYYYLRKKDHQMIGALFAAALVSVNPLGVEAIAWSCCLGYVMTLTWLMLGLLVIEILHNKKWAPLLLAGLQILAFLTWDWGIVLFPVFAILVFFPFESVPEPGPVAEPRLPSFANSGPDLVSGADSKGQRRGTFRKAFSLLLPCCVCWLLGLALRAVSDYGVRWQENSLETIGRFLIAAPVIGLFPQFEKETYHSFWGILLIIGTYATMLFLALRKRMVGGLFLCFFVCSIPWILFGNFSGRYFYLSVPFLYMGLVLGNKRKALLPLSFFLILQSYWMAERVGLWENAYQRAQQLRYQIQEIAVDQKALVVVNLPEAYGPENLAMRPQIWYGGLQVLIPNTIQVRTHNCPFVWKGGRNLVERDQVASLFPEQTIWEVVYKNKNDWHDYTLKPFQ